MDLRFDTVDARLPRVQEEDVVMTMMQSDMSSPCGDREAESNSDAGTASPDYVKFQAVIKSAASAASLRGGCASG